MMKYINEAFVHLPLTPIAESQVAKANREISQIKTEILTRLNTAIAGTEAAYQSTQTEFARGAAWALQAFREELDKIG